MKNVRGFRVLILVGSLFFYTSCNSMHYARASLPVVVVVALVFWAYNRLFQDPRVDVIDENVKEVKTDVRGLKEASNKIKKGVHKVKKDTVELKEGAKELQKEVQDFRKETKESFVDVRTDITVAKNELLQELTTKEKNLTKLIECAKDDIKGELEESSNTMRDTLQAIAETAKKAATKEEIAYLKTVLDAKDELVENVRGELLASIKASESRQKGYMKSLLKEAELRQEDQFKQLRISIEKIEKENNGIKKLVNEGNEKIGFLGQKIDKIDSAVGDIKGLLLK